MTIGLRPEVQRFAALMERVLRENDHKGGWEEMSLSALLARLQEEVNELVIAAYPPRADKPEISCEAADVANFAMFIADNFGGLMEAEA